MTLHIRNFSQVASIWRVEEHYWIWILRKQVIWSNLSEIIASVPSPQNFEICDCWSGVRGETATSIQVLTTLKLLPQKKATPSWNLTKRARNLSQRKRYEGGILIGHVFKKKSSDLSSFWPQQNKWSYYFSRIKRSNNWN